MRALWLAALIMGVGACNSSPRVAEAPGTGTPTPAATQPAAAPPAGAKPAAFRVARQPPAAKDVIEAVIASANVPLSVSPTCTNVGTEPSDTTIGRYLAGFLAELSAPNKKNWVETKVEAGRSADGETVSVCTLTLRHQDGDDRWGWGVRFHVRSSDGVVLTNSFTCVGAG
jgi:hypothetical protein